MGKIVADIGCGGGIYARAFAEMGARQIVRVEPSAQMRRNASAHLKDLSNIAVRKGSAAETGLAAASVDIVFPRAIIHHLQEPLPFLAEAARVLAPDGILVVQDRTFEDLVQPASSTHLRGMFFEKFPQLTELERKRRPHNGELASKIQCAGFTDIEVKHVSETRRIYKNREQLCQDLAARTGRSLLHALSGRQLDQLIEYVTERVPESLITVRDRWTFWVACKPG